MLAAVMLILFLGSCANPASASGTLIGTWGQNGITDWTFNGDSTFSSTQGTGTFTYTSTTIVVTYTSSPTSPLTYSYSISGNYLTLTITVNTVPSSAIFARM